MTSLSISLIKRLARVKPEHWVVLRGSNKRKKMRGGGEKRKNIPFYFYNWFWGLYTPSRLRHSKANHPSSSTKKQNLFQRIYQLAKPNPLSISFNNLMQRSKSCLKDFRFFFFKSLSTQVTAGQQVTEDPVKHSFTQQRVTGDELPVKEVSLSRLQDKNMQVICWHKSAALQQVHSALFSVICDSIPLLIIN